ncbi:MAG: exonuclease subunit SbcD [Myxococcales bacterium]|nr:exonuclease subunit SbcD [Myxococcales bacterium]
MRVLHTADWHLGHTLHGHSRVHEHASFLAWLTEVIVAGKVDALIIAGDIFDGANPPTSALTMYYEFIAELKRISPAIDVLVIGGNHDSASRLDAPEALLAALGVHVVGGLVRRSGADAKAVDVERLVVSLKDAKGEVRAQVAALPFMRQADLPATALECEASDPLVEGVREAYAQVLQTARSRQEAGQALIATGHCYMVGSQISEMSERRVLGGNQHALPVEIFPDDIDYVALGHLHKAQRVGWRECVRYSGSPIPLSMSEENYRHQVVLVDFKDGQLDDWKALAIPRTTELVRIEAASPAEALSAIEELDDALDREDLERPYLEIKVGLKEPVSDLREQVEKALEGKRPRLVKTSITYSGDRRNLSDSHAGERLADLIPRDVLLRRYSRDYEGEPPTELLEAFAELVDEVGQAES